MRFRPANIRLINRRSNLPRLLLALCSINGKSKDNDKNNPTVVQELTGSLHISEGLLNKEVQFLSKPYTRRELARKIRFVLSEGSFPQKEEGSNAKQTHSDSGR